MDHKPRQTPQEIAQDAMDRAADLSAIVEEQYAFARSLLKWEGEAAEVLEQRRTTWLLGVLSRAPVQRGHVADELAPRTDNHSDTHSPTFDEEADAK